MEASRGACVISLLRVVGEIKLYEVFIQRKKSFLILYVYRIGGACLVE